MISRIVKIAAQKHARIEAALFSLLFLCFANDDERPETF
jgi:hypothetical protein